MNISNRFVVWAVGVPVLLGSAILVWAGSKPDRGSLLEPENATVVAEGKAIYAANCASCHGANLEGEANWQQPKTDLTMPAPPHDETGHTWHHTDRVLFDLTKYGLGKLIKNPDYKTNMPVYDGVLSDKEIVAVLSFIKSTWPEKVRSRHDALNLKSKEQEK